jgi:hypothetical protein
MMYRLINATQVKVDLLKCANDNLSFPFEQCKFVLLKKSIIVTKRVRKSALEV